jgi:glycosyltransferase involved in cell wall biosynthesis
MAGASRMTEYLNQWRARHHGSHRHLLQDTPSTPYPMDVDAIIVPTGRKPAAMRQAMALAATLDCTLLALCSKWSSAEAVARLPEARNVKLIAIDAGALPGGLMPGFRTCGMLERTRFARRTDTSAKRNLGLLLARLIGWNKVVFIDDDIVVPEPLDLRDAAGLTSYYAGVGLHIEGMRDNSVVCHAYREAGGSQDMFVGGGALAVAVDSANSFFPNIYNEDWFFLLDDEGLQKTTLTGVARQKPYDPFASEDRARREEFGDTLAEGLFWLLDDGRSIQDADHAFWESYIGIRRRFIDQVAGMVDLRITEPDRHFRMLTSLDAARSRNKVITPDWCVRYVEAWREDRFTWRRHTHEMFRNHVVRKRRAHRDRRSFEGVQRTLRSLELSSFFLSLPGERLDHDSADLRVSLAPAVGQ